jgi:hypothetical protein
MKASVLLLFLTALLRSNMAASGTGRSLPQPSGNFGVSRVAYDWVDVSRPETAISDPNAHRELMVYVWYPTDKKPISALRAEYLPGADKIAKHKSAKDAMEFWGDSWPETSEHAPIAFGTKKFPLLVFAPGLGLSSTTYTSAIQELVSHGYVIASIEPTYEVGAVMFPDGRVVTERPEATGPGPSPPNESREQFLKRLHSFDGGHIDKWADDMRYVIGQITMLNGETGANRAPFSGRIDLSNIGAWGHSFGGRAAARLCQIDEHVKACLDADGLGPDGPIFAYEGEKLPSQPFMWIDVFHVPPSDSQLAPYGMTREQWEKNHAEQLLKNEKELSECRGGSYHITVNLPEIEHFSFTDQPIITAKAKQDVDHAIETLTILDDYVHGFFDRYLKARIDSDAAIPH